MTIYEYLRGYKASRFHTPGHKGTLDPLDITEIEGSFPLDIIDKAQQKTSAIYGADNMRYLINGSSGGMKAALLAARGDVVSEGYRHRCVDEGTALAGYRVYTVPETENIGLPRLLTPSALGEALDAHPKAVAAVVQYPDYYGRCVDLAAIEKIVHARGKLLIVDSAHGAHFAFRPDIFPVSATAYADICNLSAHKTLCAYTQTAYLAYRNGVKQSVENALDLLGTTSPNYVFMAQLEKAADDALVADYDRIKSRSLLFRAALPMLENDDFTRLVLDCTRCGGGKRVFETLISRGIVAEKYDENRVIFILTPEDTDEALNNLMIELMLIRSKL